MRFLLCAVGTPRPPLAAAIAEYEARLARYWPFEVRTVREGRGDAATVRRQEGERLREAAGAARLVACTEDGEVLPSAAFAARMARWQEEARDLAFVVGGAHGFDATVVAASERRLALAPFTLPHELARLVLAEQLYRAGTIRRGEPYHK